jgi:hypothetical protein
MFKKKSERVDNIGQSVEATNMLRPILAGRASPCGAGCAARKCAS